MLIFFLSFAMVSLKTNCLRIYWTDLHQIFRISTNIGRHDQSDLFSRSLKGSCYCNRVLALIGENWPTPPSFCVLAFHNGREDRNIMDAR